MKQSLARTKEVRKIHDLKYRKRLTNQQKNLRLKIRKIAVKLTGKECHFCNTTEKLHLHHLWYEPDSVKSNATGSTTERIREAIRNPERFVLLCISCHSKLTAQYISLNTRSLNEL